MSNSDSFIDEVGEEVRRDWLYALMRRYGWIPLLVVVLLVAGAAWNEYSKARTEASAEAFGDAIVAAMATDDPADRQAALDTIEPTGQQHALVTLLAAEDGTQEAADALEALSRDTTVDATYRELATLKHVMMAGSGLSAADRIERLAPLTAAGAPFRSLAQEQTALAQVDLGDTDAALDILRSLLDEGTASEGLRRRASQLIVALGGSLDDAS